MVELHCHAEGIVGPAIIRKLLARGLDFGFDLARFEGSVLARSWDTWVSDYWELTKPQLEQPDRLPAIVEVHVADLVRQGVEYVELMLANFHPMGGETLEGAVERLRRFRRAVDRSAEGRIEVVFLVAVMRRNHHRLDEFAERVVALGREGLVAGFAIAGDENACSIKEWRPMIERVRTGDRTVSAMRCAHSRTNRLSRSSRSGTSISSSVRAAMWGWGWCHPLNVTRSAARGISG